MRPLSESTARIAGQSFERKFIALGRIVSHWADIVGKDLAHKTFPVKIIYHKKERGGKPDAVLEISCSSADATLLHYQKDLILERINQIFGDRWIGAIRFVANAANTQSVLRKKAQPPLTPREKHTLSSLLSTIADEDVRARLENLGQAIIMEDKS